MSEEAEQTRDLVTTEPPFSNVLATQRSRAVFLPANLAQAMELAHFMAGGIGVRQWMRGNPSACLALIQISMRWGMDPYIVANKAYYANDTLSFESQLVNAVINTSGELVGRLKVEFQGDASGGVGKETLNCRVSGRLRADPEQVFVHEQPLQSITIRNSPLWKVNPKQQLQYHATRAWARLYMPEVLLGIYTPDEVADGVAQQIEEQSTPRAGKAPDRRDFVDNQAEDAEVEEIPTVSPDIGQETEEKSEKGGDSGAKDEKTADSVDDSVDLGAEIDTASDVQPVEEGDSVRADGISADGPGLTNEVDRSDVPVEPLEWAAWKSETTAQIEAVSDMGQFDRLKKRIQPVLDQADDDLLSEIQGLLADKLVTLPGTEGTQA